MSNLHDMVRKQSIWKALHLYDLGLACRFSRRRRRERLILLSIVGAVTLLLALSPIRIGIVLGESMMPSLKPHHAVLIDRSYYKTHIPIKGEVIVFKAQGELLVKRVAAGPGDNLWLLEHPYAPIDMQDSEIVDPNDLPRINELLRSCPKLGSLQRISIPMNWVFVVGDAEDISLDSRHFGPISVNQIVGRALVPDSKSLVGL
jgi:signal peptidase I